MKIIKNIFTGKGYIESISIVSIEGEYLFNSKFSEKLGSTEIDYNIIGQKYFDIIENLKPETSSVYKAMEIGLPIYVENQRVKCIDRNESTLNSLSIPIKINGRIVGAIDLSVASEPNGSGEDSFTINLARGIKNNSLNKLKGSKNQAFYNLEDIITNDPKMNQLKEYLSVVAGCDLPVMIYGETGTGKELFAHSIHNLSERKDKPFVVQNCAAIPENLLESILFGTAKGAFTGAIDNKGLLEMADKGTLFLDEINSMTVNLQAKLLRIIQEGSFRKLGSMELIKVDLKIIASMNKKPQEALEEGLLRKDLFYRLSIMSINIPPLRERKNDIKLLFDFFINRNKENLKIKSVNISSDLYDKLEEYSWPGNLRELEHIAVYGLSKLGKNESLLKYSHIIGKLSNSSVAKAGNIKNNSLKIMMEEYEKDIINDALSQTEYNISQAAKILNVPRTTLFRKARGYDLI